MYMEGSSQYEYHLKTYGHPSKFGYKDTIPLWKAEAFAPAALIRRYAAAGAKYFVSMGVHCDNFDLWNSRNHRWNSVKMGPRRDIVGEWRQAAREAGLRFGVSEHVWASYNWWTTNSLCATFCHAQAENEDATFLRQAREKYDAPFGRNLQSFSCAVEFNWKQHFTEAVRVGDEGTDEDIAKLIQPIRTRVTVSQQNAAVSSGMTDDEERRLPHGGMAEGLLAHAVQYSLNNWLAASNNALLPSEDTPVHVEPSVSGYKLEFKIQTFDVRCRWRAT